MCFEIVRTSQKVHSKFDTYQILNIYLISIFLESKNLFNDFLNQAARFQYHTKGIHQALTYLRLQFLKV